MMESSCFCGERLAGEDMDALVVAGVGHFGSAHPEMGLPEPSIRNYLEGERRVDGPVDRLDSIGELEIRPVSSETRDDILEFFDRRAFADNLAWSACYCMYHHVGGGPDGEWPLRSWQRNRSDLSDRIDSGASTGVVAYVDGALAGFCNAGPREGFVTRSKGESDAGVGSIVCFVVAPPFRGRGVARAMLRGAVAVLTEAGCERAEAYPIRDPENASVAFVGSLGLYESEGFAVVSEAPLVVGRALA